MFRLLCAAILVLAPAAAEAQLSGGAFTPVPCPEQTWEYRDPTFQALPNTKAFFGTYEGGLYRIEVPDNWNGELVLFAHGLVDNEGPQGSVLRVNVPAQLRGPVLERRFALAASSYRCNGYVPGTGLVDTVALTPLVSKLMGREPSRVYLVGTSMGGHVATLAVEQLPGRIAGAMAMCASGPSTLDFLTSISAAAGFIGGQGLVGLVGDASPVDMKRLADVFGMGEMLTARGRQLASLTIHSSGGPRPFAVEGLTTRFLDNIRDGVRVRQMVPWSRAATNEGFPYSIEEGLGLSNAELGRIRKLSFDPALRNGGGRYAEVAAFTGKLGRPLLMMHGTGDLYVPISGQRLLRQAVEKAGFGHQLVQRVMRIPGHCGFSPEEQVRGFDDLVAWVRDGKRPEGDDVMSDLSDAGRKFTTPLRPGDPGTVTVSSSVGATR